MNTLFKTLKINFLVILITQSLNAQINNPVEKASERIQMGEFEEAITLLNKNTEGDNAKELLVEAYVKTGKIAEAEKLISTIKNEISQKLLISLIYQYTGRYDESLKTLSEINIENIKEIDLKYSVIKALGINYWLTNNFSFAEHLLKDYHNNYAKQHKVLASSCNNLGLVYLQNNPTVAINYFLEGLNSYTLTKPDLTKISLNNNLALAYKTTNKIDEALNTFDTSLLFIDNNFNNTPIQAYVFNNISQLYFEKKDLNRSIEFALKGNSILKRYYKKPHPEISSSDNLLTSFYIHQKKYVEAEKQLCSAYENNTNTFNEKTDQNCLLFQKFDNVINKRLFVESMILEAELYEAKYYYKNPKLQLLKNALKIYQTADSILYEIRKNTKLENDKIALNKATTQLYDNAIITALKIYDFGINKDEYYDIAYNFTEKRKSSVLLDAINDSKSKKFAGIPDSILNKEIELKSMISFYELNKSQIPNANHELVTLYNKNTLLLKLIEARYPKYFELKYQNSTIKTKELQAKLTPDQILINYHISDLNPNIICFIISKNKTESIITPKDELFEKRLISLRNAVNYSDSKLLIKSINYLNDKLLNFKIKKEAQLIIIPDPKLGNIPFEIMTEMDTKKDTTSFDRINYIIKHHAISYYYSSNLFLLHFNGEKTYSNNALLCSPVNYKNGLVSLPGAEKEIYTVDSILTLQKNETQKLLFADATEGNLKYLLNKKFKYVMISSHGIVDEMSPEKSEIFLNSDSKEDGNLYANEIYNLNIDTRLLLLPCCQTGLGKIIKGEGIMGLSRALIFSGVQTMILSLWNVSDTYSQDITKNFFTELPQSNENMAVSLQKSKIKLLKNKESANPYFWAPYILIGK